ncbi:hypothetical protein AB4554_06960 [Vibrio breoganii]
MSVNFDVVMDTDDYSVDMNSGLDTLKGASEATRQIAETLLTEHVPKRLTTESKVRTRLKKSFKGSYGQIFSLEIEDDELKKRFRKIGKAPFTELMSYFINEALYQDCDELSDKAKKTLNGLDERLQKELVEQLRKSSLDHLHTVSTNFNQDVKLRYRENQNNQTTIVKVDRESRGTLVPRTDKSKVEIIASITRLNINTGNGRLLIQGQNETVAFGFPSLYKDVKYAAKKKFSTNLDSNNARPRDEWETLKLRAHTQKTNNGRIIKYLIEGFSDD